MPHEVLASLIRPSGYFNVKARRLKAFLGYFVGRYAGDPLRMRRVPLERLREELLGVNGVGPETADSILLYALGKPTFVVDTYTKRIFSRLGLAEEAIDYHDLQRRFVAALPRDVSLFNEYHALIVIHGKSICRPKPKCCLCPLATLCPTAGEERSVSAVTAG